MSSSSGSNEARGSWITVNRQLLSNLKKVSSYNQTIPSEDAFRKKFNKFPEAFNAPNALRNYGIFKRLHQQMLSIVRALDQALHLESPDSLGDVFWTYALAALNAVIGQGHEFQTLNDLYRRLNSADDIPIVITDLAQFPESIKVQEPLQEIFVTYIDCYYVFVSQYAMANEEEGVNLGPIFETIAEANSNYKKAEYNWRMRLSEAIKYSSRSEQSMSSDATLVPEAALPPGIQLKFIRHLGKGAYGNVDEVMEVSTSIFYARKSIPTRIIGQDSAGIEKRVKNEVEIMSKLRHNHIASINMFFKEHATWNLIMSPVADCDLRVFLDEKCVDAKFPRHMIQMIDPWFGCLISALAFAHTEMVKHEDIKPQNILLYGGKVYLTDFGTAMDFSQLERSTVSDYFEKGTPIYWAPEPRAWGRPADVFALGCVFSEMITVRQGRNLDDYRKYRHNPKKEFGYAYRANLPMVRSWLKREIPGIDRNDPVGQMILEQTLNMLTEDPLERSEAPRLRRVLTIEPALFCSSCA